jgi:cytoskeletal protein CcmA (bactofilin family)
VKDILMRIPAIRRRKLTLASALLLFALIGVVSRVEASDGMRGDRCEVAEGETIVEDFYFFCRILDVRGTIDGDLIGVATDVTIHESAVVTGDVWVAAGRLIVAGIVGDDVHFGGVTLLIHDTASFSHQRVDALAISINTEIHEGAFLPGDLLMYGYQARVDGIIGGDIDFGGEALIINGTVQGRVDAEVGDTRRSADVPNLPVYDLSFSNPGLRMGLNARIEGDLAYKSRSPGLIPLGAVQGRTRFEQTGSQMDITRVGEADDAAEILVAYLEAVIRDVITLLLIGVVVLRLAPNLIRRPAQHVRRRTVPTVGWGLITFMLSIPLTIVVIVLGLIIVLVLYFVNLNELTIMVGVGLLIVSSGLVGGFAFLLLFMGRVVVSFTVGQILYRYVLRLPEGAAFRRWVAIMAVGTVVYALITNAPVPPMGLIFELVTALAGVGALVMVARAVVYESAPVMPPAPIVRPVPLLSPPPTPALPDDRAAAPGMENLPEGFKGFDEDW